jgi:hypothetical protein
MFYLISMKYTRLVVAFLLILHSPQPTLMHAIPIEIVVAVAVRHGAACEFASVIVTSLYLQSLTHEPALSLLLVLWCWSSSLGGVSQNFYSTASQICASFRLITFTFL